MFKPINGFTKEKMIEMIKARNTGDKCMITREDGSSFCSYDDGKGNHCAVGIFMPDGHEGMSYTGGYSRLFNRYPDLKISMPLEPETMGQLQEIHDKQPEGIQVRSALINWINENVS